MTHQSNVLGGLFARLVESKDSNGWFVDGRISDEERAALGIAAGLKFTDDDSIAVVDEPKSKVVPVVIDKSLINSIRPSSSTVLCIDFGTAASKAAINRPGEKVSEQLDLGIRAGESAGKPWVSSTIGVNDAGLIVFGPAAEKCANRITSIKSRLWDATDSIGGELLQVDGHSFSGAGCLVAYLAYLTRLISAELDERDLSPYLPRRYAMPFTEDPARKALREKFAVWLGQAQLLADTLGDRLLEGVAPSELRGALDALHPLRAPAWFIRNDPACIGEPVAAGSFALSADIADRAVYMIIDIGAGTSDFCVLAVKNRADGDVEVYRAPGSDYSCQVAGDAVDMAFQDYVRDELFIGTEGSEAADLERNRRSWKEQLFNTDILDVSVGDDLVPLELHLSQFTSSPYWKSIQAQLQEAQNICFKGVDKGWIKQWGVGPIRVVITGGGAKLPLRDTLADGRVEQADIAYMRVPESALPASLQAIFQTPDDIPRLIVALGGCMPKPPYEHDRSGVPVGTEPPKIWQIAGIDKSASGLDPFS